jgi:hypothetical protein
MGCASKAVHIVSIPDGGYWSVPQYSHFTIFLWTEPKIPNGQNLDRLENHHGCGGEEKFQIPLLSIQEGTFLPQDGVTLILMGSATDLSIL